MREETAKDIRDQELNDIRELMSFKVNRRVIWRLLEMAGLYRSSFALETPRMAFNEGQRNLGLAVMADIMEACPERYAAMQREAKEREDERRILDERRADDGQ